jgi:flavodoxin I
MIAIGLFFGSTDGATARVAQLAKRLCEENGWAEVELLDVADYYLEEMQEFEHLILAIPTWNVGQLQRDWERVMDEFDDRDLSGKRAAIIGLGDQVGYPATFVDAMVFLADKVEACGALLTGDWPTDGYDFTQSWAVRNGRFIGLVLDEVNQPHLTEERLRRWLTELRCAWNEPS